MKHLLRKVLEVNVDGVDYYIGDLHGSYNLFETLLKAIKFNPDVDRIISVGDLVDRGPDSVACLGLLRKPWFHAVLSNHEQMAYHAFNADQHWAINHLSGLWYMNGGGWGLQACVAALNGTTFDDEHVVIRDLVHLIGDLPHFITVRQPDGGNIHVIHAELPTSKHFKDSDFEDPEQLQRYYNMGLDHRGISEFQWGRNRFYNLYDKAVNESTVDKIKRTLNRSYVQIGSSESLVISGHTIVRQPTRIGNFLNLDTGAYVSAADPRYGLTCYNSKSQSFITVHSDRVNYSVQPFVYDPVDE